MRLQIRSAATEQHNLLDLRRRFATALLILLKKVQGYLLCHTDSHLGSHYAFPSTFLCNDSTKYAAQFLPSPYTLYSQLVSNLVGSVPSGNRFRPTLSISICVRLRGWQWHFDDLLKRMARGLRLGCSSDSDTFPWLDLPVLRSLPREFS